MPRHGRVAVPECPHHLLQRGHNRQPVFHEPTDFQAYLDTLAEFRSALSLRVYAYCLMTNHIHLIVDPGTDPQRLGLLMKRLARRHTRRINRLRSRSGTAWGGRSKCSPIETDSYLLICCRYIELNPVRARMVARPEDYPWSSYRAKVVGLSHSDLPDPDPCYLALGTTPAERAARYRRFVQQGIEDDEAKFLREAAQRNQLTGSQQFAARVLEQLDQAVVNRPPGRPRKNAGQEK
jgi:putative transposase